MSNAGGFVPGHDQVQVFDSLPEGVDEDEYEEEIEYHMLNLGAVDPVIIANAGYYRLIGLDTSTPYLQTGGTTYQGTYETIIGSQLILVDSAEDENGRAQVEGFVIPSEKHIRFREVVLEPWIQKQQGTSNNPENPKTKSKSSGGAEPNTTDGQEEGSSHGRGRGRGRGRGTGRGRGKGAPRGKGKGRATNTKNPSQESEDGWSSGAATSDS